MDKNDKSVLDDNRIGRLLVKIAIPIFMATFVTLMYNVISTIFVGRYVGALGIGGIAIVLPIQTLSIAIAQLFGAGGASVISRAIGAGDRERAERTLGNAVLCIVVLSALIMIFGLADTDFWLRVIGASPDILPYARDYLNIILFGIFFQTLALTLSNLITAEGNARTSMIGMVLGAASNILLDVIFVVFLRWGVKGAAMGTVLAQILSTAYLFAHFYRGKSFLKIHIRNLPIRWELIGSMASIGVSIFFMNIAWSVATIILNNMLVIYGSGLAVSAYGIVGRLTFLSVLPGMSISQGMQPILGFNYGKQRFDRALRVIKIAITASSVFSIRVFLLFQVAAMQIAGIFTSDADLIKLASYAIRVVFSTCFLTGLIVSSICIFQSLGKAKQSFVVTLRTVIFMLPFILILPRFFELDGIFLTYPLTELCGFLLALILLIPQLRELSRLNAGKKLQYN